MEKEFKLTTDYNGDPYEDLSFIIFRDCIEKLEKDLGFYFAVNIGNRFLIKEIKQVTRCLMTVVDLNKEHLKESFELKIKSIDSESSHDDREDIVSKKWLYDFYGGLLNRYLAFQH